MVINSTFYYMRECADTETKQPFINIVRQFIQKVVIGKAPGHQPAALQVHGDIAKHHGIDGRDRHDAASIRGSCSERLMSRIASGEIDTEQKRKKLLEAYAEELLKRFPEWENLQVSVVAGGLTAWRLVNLSALKGYKPARLQIDLPG